MDGGAARRDDGQTTPRWSCTVALRPVGMATLLVVLAVLAFRAVTSWAAGDPAGLAWLPTALAAALFVLIATTMAFQVRVDARGLTVRSIFGLPRFRVPLDEVVAVRVVHVRPLLHFGGWGIRRAHGVRGVVLRRGSAIAVARRDGRPFLVTVPDAAAGAMLLRSLTARRRASHAG